MIRDRFSVVMMRTVLELQGTPCIPMEEERIGRDQLIFSRSFATPITTAAGIRQVMSDSNQVGCPAKQGPDLDLLDEHDCGHCEHEPDRGPKPRQVRTKLCSVRHQPTDPSSDTLVIPGLVPRRPGSRAPGRTGLRRNAPAPSPWRGRMERHGLGSPKSTRSRHSSRRT